MKTLLYFLFSGISVFALANNNTFEGTLTLSNNAEGATTGESVSLSVKGDKIAFGVSDAKAPKMVLDVSTGYFYSVIDQGSQKMVMKMNIKALGSIDRVSSLLGSSYGQLLGNVSEDENASVKQTGEIKTIDGYKAEKYIIKDSKYETVVWLTDQVPFSFSSIYELMGASGNLNELKSMLPLEGTVKELKSGAVSNFSIKVQKKTIDGQVVQIPDSYPEMDITSMVKQMVETSDQKQLDSFFEQMKLR